MITLTVTGSLSALMSPGEHGASGSMRSVPLHADDWAGAVAEIRERFPQLAERVLTAAGDVRPGFLLAINDTVTPAHEPVPGVRPGDEVVMLVQIAGGAGVPGTGPSSGSAEGCAT